MGAKKRTKSSKPSPRVNAGAGRSGRAADHAETRHDDALSGQDAADRSHSGVRTSPRATGRKRKSSSAPRPPQLEAVFSPVEIDFFERAADMYADEYDVWEDFRRAELN